MSELHQIKGCENAARKADVVFVHGLGGDAFETWRHGNDESTSWPHWLGAEFPEVGVWSLGYAASPSKWSRFWSSSRDSGHAMPLPRRAQQVLDLMVQRGLGERPVLFIGHSLGGLVVKHVLRASSDDPNERRKKILASTRAVLFLATPHAGASMASLLNAFRSILGTTVSMEDLRAHDAHLADLFDWYRNHAAAAKIQTSCYFEGRGVKGLTIVNPTSSHPGVGSNPVELDEDHLSIAKPRQRNAQVCGAARDLLHSFVLKPRAAPRPAAPLNPANGPTVKFDVPFELPPPAEEYFGREVEVKRLVERLTARKNTAVVGPAGLGKTALAAKALRKVVGDNADTLAASPFPDGVVLLDLYALRGKAEPAWDALANRIAGPGFMEQAGSQERASEACRGRRLLVVVEGGEEADGSEGRTTISELLRVLWQPQNCYLWMTRLTTQAAVAEAVELKDALHPEDAARLLDAQIQGRVSAELRNRALKLLDGHPLALTWAGNLLARGDDDPRRLVADWEAGGLPALSDPREARHTLEWLFNRSVRGLTVTERQALEAGALLASAPFPLAAIAAALGDSSQEGEIAARTTLRSLVRTSLLRLSQDGERWQFSHVLSYQFSRKETGSDARIRERLGLWLHAYLERALSNATADWLVPVSVGLEHLAALLRVDDDQALWRPLVTSALHSYSVRLNELGQLSLVRLALSAITGWLQRFPSEKADQPEWIRERSALLSYQGNMLRDQGDLVGALAAYRESLDGTQWLALADPSNTVWQRDLSLSQEKMGDVLRDQGDLAGAMATYQQSLHISQRLAAADPSNTIWQRDVSTSQEKLGDVLREQGNLAGALGAYQESMDVRRRLADTDPSNTIWQRDLSTSQEKTGDVLRDQGDLAGALGVYRESMDVRRQLADTDPSNTIWQRDLTVSHDKLGNVLRDQGDLAGALSAYGVSLELRQHLVSADPFNARWQHDLCVAQDNVGDVLRDRGDLIGALSAYSKSLELRQQLVSADPSNARCQQDLSVSQDNVGDVLRAKGDLAGALSAYGKSLDLRQRLARVNPSNAGWQHHLCVSHCKIGDVQRDQGNLAGALLAYQESLEASGRLAQTDPSNTGWQRDLSVSHSKIGDVQRNQGNLAAAMSAYQQSLEVSRRLAQTDPSNTEWQHDLCVSHYFVGNVLHDQGDLDEALSAYRESLEGRRRLARFDPSNAGWQCDLCASEDSVGNVLRDQRDLVGALSAYQESFERRLRLAKADPSNAGWQRDLHVSHNKIGDVLRDQGDLAGALSAYRKSLEVSRRLARTDPSNAGWQRDLWFCLTRIGITCDLEGAHVEAMSLMQESLPIIERLAALDPTNVTWQNDAAFSRSFVARLPG
ncbi:MAG: tetratricopeptide repeat protein [Bryobacteraceae bacterium]